MQCKVHIQSNQVRGLESDFASFSIISPHDPIGQVGCNYFHVVDMVNMWGPSVGPTSDLDGLDPSEVPDDVSISLLHGSSF